MSASTAPASGARRREGLRDRSPPARNSPRFELKLGVTSDVPHWCREGAPLAYAPYVREMNLWGRLFARVEVLAPYGEGPVRGNVTEYAAPAIRWRPVRYSMADGREGQRKRLLHLPGAVRAVHGLLRRNDFVLLRSPGHLSFMGRVIANGLGLPTLTKWAGPFFPHTGERLTARLERLHVRRGPDPALIYGPAEREHLISFFPAAMTAAELRHARALAAGRRWEPPWRLLGVGRLHPDKHFDLALEGLARLRRAAPELSWSMTLVGDGAERASLEALVRERELGDRVRFTGTLEFSRVQRLYARSHVVIMPGTTEGWGKPINEAWAHGAVPVVAEAGVGPWILRKPDSGVTFEPTPEGLAAALSKLLRSPERMRTIGGRGARLSEEISLEEFERQLESILVRRCGLG